MAEISSTKENLTLFNISKDSKNLAVLNNVLTIFFGFIPCLVLFLVKADDAFVKSHAREALNFCITMFIGYVIASILTFVLIGFLLFPVLGITWLVLLIIASVKASKGEEYRYPFILRLIK